MKERETEYEEIAELLKDQYVSMLLYEVKKGNVKEEILAQLIKKNREGKEWWKK